MFFLLLNCTRKKKGFSDNSNCQRIVVGWYKLSAKQAHSLRAMAAQTPLTARWRKSAQDCVQKLGTSANNHKRVQMKLNKNAQLSFALDVCMRREVGLFWALSSLAAGCLSTPTGVISTHLQSICTFSSLTNFVCLHEDEEKELLE